MKRILSAALLVAALSIQSCTFIRFNESGIVNGSSAVTAVADKVTEVFDLPEFNMVEVQVHGDVAIKQADGESSAEVTFAQNLMEYLQLNVEDGVLVIKMDESKRYRYNDMDIYLKTPTLNSVVIKGAGDIDITELVTDDFSVTIKGAGDVDVDHLECSALNALIQGAGDIRIGGKAESANLTIQGAGDIDVRDLECDDITSKVQGAGSIERK